MNYQCLTVERRDNHIGIVTLNRPESLNTLNAQLLAEIEQVTEALSRDTDIRVVVFTGAGRYFCGGVDLTEVPSLDNTLAYLRFIETGPRLIRKIFEMNPITIAAVNGGAFGGGACIAAACDFRIGSTDCKAGFPESKLGMNLSWRALPLVVRLIGPANAKEMVILGKNYSAETLLKWGFLSQTVSPEELLAAAGNMALEYAQMPPIPAQMIKKSVNHLSSALDDAIMHMDSDQWLLTSGTKDFAEGVSAFLEKRQAVFQGK